MPARPFELLHVAIGGVVRAPHLDSALDALMDALSQAFQLWFGSVFGYTLEGKARILASRSVAGTVFEVGTEINPNITEAVAARTQEVLRGFPVVFGTDEGAMGMLDDILQDEGVRAMIVLPLQLEEVTIGGVGLGSSSDVSVMEESIPLFTGVVRGIEARLIELMRASGRAKGTTLVAGD